MTMVCVDRYGRGSAMSSGLQFDEAASHRIEATYMTADMIEQRRVVRGALALTGGEDVLDIGSGPGLLAVEIAASVGDRRPGVQHS